MSNELKPCPFCGEKAIMKIEKHIPSGYDYTPTCRNPSCAGRLTKKWTNEAVAIEAWNSRAERKTFHVIDKKTGQEADSWEIALNEDWAKHLCYCDMEGFAILEDGTLILADECGRFEFIQEEDRFEIVWDEVTNE